MPHAATLIPGDVLINSGYQGYQGQVYNPGRGDDRDSRDDDQAPSPQKIEEENSL